MTPIQPKALKVERGHVTQVQEEGVSQRPPYVNGESSLSAPDGTYLRLDYVLEVMNGYEDQVAARGGSQALLEGLGALRQYFAERAL